jgi:drug/metabolite transporter (DMT)-like permease
VWLLKNAPISTVDTYAYVNPVIAIFLGWAILSEDVTLTTVGAAALVVLSVAAVVRREGEPDETVVPAPGSPPEEAERPAA